MVAIEITHMCIYKIISAAARVEDGCVDEDECELDMFHCDPAAECKNTNGSYDCICREGFTGDGFTCQVKKRCEEGKVKRRRKL